MLSLMSQSAQIPTMPSGPTPTSAPSPSTPVSNDHYVTSPTTSGYSSYGASPVSARSFSPPYDQNGFDSDPLDIKPFDDMMDPISPCTPNTMPYVAPNSSSGYPQPNYMNGGYNSVYSVSGPQNSPPPPYGTDQHYANGGDEMYGKPFGMLSGSNFCFSNYPQCVEGLLKNHSLQHSLCKVCGDVASGNHFGVLSCEACKSFFRRSIRANARYACRGNRTCAIEKHTRNRCQYCRLQKCISCGMRKEAVQEERTPQGAKLQRASTPTPLGFSSLQFTPPSVPYFPTTFDSPTSPVPRMLSHSASRMYGSLPNLKMEFDRSSSAVTNPMTPQARSFTPSNLDVSASPSNQISVSVLVNADMQSDNQPETVTTTASNLKLEDLFDGIKASLLKVIEWAKRLPAFGSLSLDDQVKLLKSSWCEHCVLKLAARNGPKSDNVLLSNGLACNKDNIEDPEVRRVLQRVFNELAYWLDYLNVDRVELACLKGILLFNPDAKGLSPASKKKVEIFQEQILQSLENRTKTMYPVSPQRFSKLLLRLAPLKAISLEVMQHMEVQRALGNAKMDNLFGELLDFE